MNSCASLDIVTGSTYGAYLNPFKYLPMTPTVLKFTEKLSKDFKKIQWTVAQHGDETDPKRTNIPLARQCERTNMLSKPQFLSFGFMRAFPRLQLRKLCVALRERSLPLTQRSTQVLLQMTLYHLGDLSDTSDPRPIWRQDMDNHGGWLTLGREMIALAKELKFKRRYHYAIPVLGELSSVGSEWAVDVSDSQF